MYRILLFTNRDSDNIGDKVIEDCDISLINVVMQNLGIQDYVIDSYDAEDIFKEFAEELIAGTDLVLIGGAPMFNYTYQYFYKRTIITIEYATKYNKPVVFSSVGIDAYDENDERCQKLKSALNSDCVKMITTRDGYEFLEQYKEREDLYIGKVADPAVFAKKVFEPYLSPVSSTDKKKIGLFVLRANGFIDNKIDFPKDSALRMWKELTQELENRGYDYELLTSGHFGDEVFLRNMIDKHGFDVNRCFFNMDTPELLVKKISSYDAVISCRMHPSIVSYALDVPAIGLVWNYKVKAFYENIGYESRALDVKDTSAQNIVDRMECAMKEGVHKEKDYMMSIYHSLYYGIALSYFQDENFAKPYSFEQIMEYMQPYSGTSEAELRKNMDRKFKRIYKKYNKLIDEVKAKGDLAKAWKDASDGFVIIYNSGTKVPELSWNYENGLGEIQKLKTGSVEYRVKARGINDGNSILLENRFCWPKHVFLGWRMRIKCCNIWYWYLEDQSLSLKSKYDQETMAGFKIFSEGEKIPILPEKCIQVIVLEAVWSDDI